MLNLALEESDVETDDCRDQVEEQNYTANLKISHQLPNEETSPRDVMLLFDVTHGRTEVIIMIEAESIELLEHICIGSMSDYVP